jgi:TetR/AcrR family transcriptional regulator
MPVPREKPTSQRILDAAEARFAAHGFAGTSLGDVADDVGIRTPSLYKHFRSKQALYVAVLERLLDPYVALLGEVLTVPEDAAQAERNLEAVVTHYLRTPNLANLVQHAALAGGKPLDLLVRRWYGPLFARARKLTPRAPGAPADPTALVLAFHAMMSGYVTMAALHERLAGRDPRSPRSVAQFVELLRAITRGLWSA